MAKYFNIDPLLIRLIWIVAALWYGFGILAYIVAIIIIPRQAAGDQSHSSGNNGRYAFGIFLVLVGVFFLARHLWIDFPWNWLIIHDIWLPAALIFIGIFLLIISRERSNLRRNGKSGWKPKPDEANNIIHDMRENQDTFTQTSARRLFRSRHSRFLFGICGGIGIRYNIDPVLVRVLWVLFSLLTEGAGVLLYFLLYFIIPLESPRRQSV